MQNLDAHGNDCFVCDFCRQPWSEDRPMVEGHRGSLICANCLSISYTELVHLDLGSPTSPGDTCVLCLETGREDPHWRSPAFEQSLACKRCIKQSAGVLHKDPDSTWQKPRDPSED